MKTLTSCSCFPINVRNKKESLGLILHILQQKGSRQWHEIQTRKFVRPQQTWVQTDGPQAVARLFRVANIWSSKNSKTQELLGTGFCAIECASTKSYFLTTETNYNFLMKNCWVTHNICLQEHRVESQNYSYLIKIQHEKVKLFPK